MEDTHNASLFSDDGGSSMSFRLHEQLIPGDQRDLVGLRAKNISYVLGEEETTELEKDIKREELEEAMQKEKDKQNQIAVGDIARGSIIRMNSKFRNIELTSIQESNSSYRSGLNDDEEEGKEQIEQGDNERSNSKDNQNNGLVQQGLPQLRNQSSNSKQSKAKTRSFSVRAEAMNKSTINKEPSTFSHHMDMLSAGSNNNNNNNNNTNQGDSTMRSIATLNNINIQSSQNIQQPQETQISQQQIKSPRNFSQAIVGVTPKAIRRKKKNFTVGYMANSNAQMISRNNLSRNGEIQYFKHRTVIGAVDGQNSPKKCSPMNVSNMNTSDMLSSYYFKDFCDNNNNLNFGNTNSNNNNNNTLNTNLTSNNISPTQSAMLQQQQQKLQTQGVYGVLKRAGINYLLKSSLFWVSACHRLKKYGVIEVLKRVQDKGSEWQLISEQSYDSFTIIQKLQSQITQYTAEILGYFPCASPFSLAKTVWDIIQIFFLLYTFWLVPLSIATGFSYSQLIGDSAIKYLLPIVLFADLLVNMNTAYNKNGLAITDREQILVHFYRDGGLAFDVIAIISVLLCVGREHHDEDTLDNYTDITTYLLFGFFWKISALRRMIKRLTDRLNLSSGKKNVLALITLFSNLLLISHLIACLWLFVGRYQQITQGNSYLNKRNIYYNHSWVIWYIQTVYYAIVTMTTVGYGDIVPVTSFEFIVCIIVMLGACGVFAYNINVIGAILDEFYRQQRLIDEKMAVINAYMSRNTVNMNLRQQIRDFLENYWNECAEKHYALESSIINDLPQLLKESLVMEVNTLFLQKSPIFRNNFSQATCKQLIHLLQEVRFSPNQVICQKDQVDDAAIYFIRNGTVSVISQEAPPGGQLQQIGMVAWNGSNSNNSNTPVNQGQNSQTAIALMTQGQQQQSAVGQQIPPVSQQQHTHSVSGEAQQQQNLQQSQKNTQQQQTTSSSSSSKEQYQQHNFSFKFLKQGETFGELAFFTGQARQATVTAVDFTTVVKINRQEFINILKSSSLDYEKFCLIRDRISLRNVFYDIGVRCYACGREDHLLQNCPLVHVMPSRSGVLQRFNFDIGQLERQPHERLYRKKFSAILDREQLDNATNRIIEEYPQFCYIDMDEDEDDDDDQTDSSEDEDYDETSSESNNGDQINNINDDNNIDQDNLNGDEQSQQQSKQDMQSYNQQDTQFPLLSLKKASSWHHNNNNIQNDKNSDDERIGLQQNKQTDELIKDDKEDSQGQYHYSQKNQETKSIKRRSIRDSQDLVQYRCQQKHFYQDNQNHGEEGNKNFKRKQHNNRSSSPQQELLPISDGLDQLPQLSQRKDSQLAYKIFNNINKDKQSPKQHDSNSSDSIHSDSSDDSITKSQRFSRTSSLSLRKSWKFNHRGSLLNQIKENTNEEDVIDESDEDMFAPHTSSITSLPSQRHSNEKLLMMQTSAADDKKNQITEKEKEIDGLQNEKNEQQEITKGIVITDEQKAEQQHTLTESSSSESSSLHDEQEDDRHQIKRKKSVNEVRFIQSPTIKHYSKASFYEALSSRPSRSSLASPGKKEQIQKIGQHSRKSSIAGTAGCVGGLVEAGYNNNTSKMIQRTMSNATGLSCNRKISSCTQGIRGSPCSSSVTGSSFLLTGKPSILSRRNSHDHFSNSISFQRSSTFQSPLMNQHSRRASGILGGSQRVEAIKRNNVSEFSPKQQQQLQQHYKNGFMEQQQQQQQQQSQQWKSNFSFGDGNSKKSIQQIAKKSILQGLGTSGGGFPGITGGIQGDSANSQAVLYSLIHRLADKFLVDENGSSRESYGRELSEDFLFDFSFDEVKDYQIYFPKFNMIPLANAVRAKQNEKERQEQKDRFLKRGLLKRNTELYSEFQQDSPLKRGNNPFFQGRTPFKQFTNLLILNNCNNNNISYTSNNIQINNHMFNLDEENNNNNGSSTNTLSMNRIKMNSNSMSNSNINNNNNNNNQKG